MSCMDYSQVASHREGKSVVSMTLQQKVAWFNLGVIAATVLAYAALVPVLGAARALGAFGLCGAWGFSILFYRRRGGQVVTDEREQLIAARSQLAALWTFWEAFVAACMVTWAVVRYRYDRSEVPVDVLPWLVLGGLVVYQVTQAAAVLVQHRRTRGREE
jgi:hypothetical protein